MGLIGRLANLARSWTTRAVAHLETPEVLIESALADARAQRNETHAALHATLTAVIETRQHATEHSTRAGRLREHAVALSNDGREAEAVATMQSALLEDRTAHELEAVADTMEAETSQLAAALTELDSVISVADAQARVDLAVLQHAKGTRAAVEARYGKPDGTPSPFEQLDEARRRTRHIQASSKATSQLGSRTTTSAPILAVPAAVARAELTELTARGIGPGDHTDP
jgi:phage shock protein A